jgi:hypothetical protein
MTHWNQLVPGVMAGVTAIIFGLIPGLPQTLVKGFVKLSEALQIRGFSFARVSQTHVRTPQPREFAIFGLAIIALTLLAFLAS